MINPGGGGSVPPSAGFARPTSRGGPPSEGKKGERLGLIPPDKEREAVKSEANLAPCVAQVGGARGRSGWDSPPDR